MNANRLLGAILGLVLLLLWIPSAESVALLAFGRTRTDSATGETYYVDQSHFQADDDNIGSEDAPWRTIQHAADVVSAGDKVIVRTGFYEERVVPQNSGMPGQVTTFVAQPGRSVTMYGFDTAKVTAQTGQSRAR